MVRRRARTTKAANVQNGGVLLEDQYVASPKRKDCKLEENGVSESETAALALLAMNEELQVTTKIRPPSGRSRKDRAADIGGRVIGVPLSTRSQVRTIENFFKAKMCEKNAQIKCEEDDDKFEDDFCAIAASSSPSPSMPEHYADDDLELKAVDEKQHTIPFAPHLQHDFLFGVIGDDTNTNNIFLQEPVLKLNIDKTLNQASSITIKKSIETEPVFSATPLLTTAALNGYTGQFISLDCNGFNCTNKPLHVPDNDNSSCDSGIAFTTSTSDNNTSLLEMTITGGSGGGGDGSTPRRKPATPHRIVCPSPVKTSSRSAGDAGSGLSPSTRNSTASTKEQLSPRKSQRHAALATSMTRRRLNHQTEDKAPYSMTKDASLSTGYNQHDDGLMATASKCAVPNQHHHQNRNLTAKSQGSKAPKLTVPVPKAQQQQQQHQQQPKMKNKMSQPLATTNCNRELTEFFPVRRSVRKTKTAVKEEMMKNLEQAILEERADGLKIAHFEGKGRGIVSDRRFQRGEFVVEYEGDLISMNEASEREKRYALDENAGCYMYYFKHKNQHHCIDATVDTGKLGRLVNHSRNGNLITKVVVVKQRPHLILIAKDDIEAGEELTYDYGDRSKESLLHHPWLAF